MILTILQTIYTSCDPVCMSYKSAKQRYPRPSVQLLQTIVNPSHRKNVAIVGCGYNLSHGCSFKTAQVSRSHKEWKGKSLESGDFINVLLPSYLDKRFRNLLIYAWKTHTGLTVSALSVTASADRSSWSYNVTDLHCLSSLHQWRCSFRVITDTIIYRVAQKSKLLYCVNSLLFWATLYLL